MDINKIKFRNFRVFRNREFIFPKGVIGVTGPTHTSMVAARHTTAAMPPRRTTGRSRLRPKEDQFSFRAFSTNEVLPGQIQSVPMRICRETAQIFSIPKPTCNKTGPTIRCFCSSILLQREHIHMKRSMQLARVCNLRRTLTGCQPRN